MEVREVGGGVAERRRRLPRPSILSRPRANYGTKLASRWFARDCDLRCRETIGGECVSDAQAVDMLAAISSRTSVLSVRPGLSGMSCGHYVL